MFSTVSNMPPANTFETPSDLVISSWNLLMKPDHLVQPWPNNTVDPKETGGKAIADFRIESTSRFEAAIARGKTSKANCNAGGQSTLTATCSSDRLDTEQDKYDPCDKIFRQTGLPEEPKAINSVAIPYEYQMCNADFNVKGDLARHTNSQGFIQSTHLKDHVRTHSDTRFFKCDVCDAGFHQKTLLYDHMRFHPDNRSLECKACGRYFKTGSALCNHKKTHSNTHSFECDMCHICFHTKSSLRNHMRIHTGDRPYKCDKCNKTFRTSGVLWNHKKTHSDERPFECNLCNFKFKRKCARTRHYQKVHSKKYPDKSSKSFTNDRNAGRNSSQPESGHSNEEPFRGSHCDAGFTSTTIVNQHIKPETHTTHSGTGVTNLNDGSTTSQLPFISNQLSTSDIHINKSQNQEEHEDLSALLNEFIDTYLLTSELESCKHEDDLSLGLDILEET